MAVRVCETAGSGRGCRCRSGRHLRVLVARADRAERGPRCIGQRLDGLEGHRGVGGDEHDIRGKRGAARSRPRQSGEGPGSPLPAADERAGGDGVRLPRDSPAGEDHGSVREPAVAQHVDRRFVADRLQCGGVDAPLELLRLVGAGLFPRAERAERRIHQRMDRNQRRDGLGRAVCDQYVVARLQR